VILFENFSRLVIRRRLVDYFRRAGKDSLVVMLGDDFLSQSADEEDWEQNERKQEVEGTDKTATTDEDGNYKIEDVEDGTYDITASADGCKSETKNVEGKKGCDCGFQAGRRGRFGRARDKDI